MHAAFEIDGFVAPIAQIVQDVFRNMLNVKVEWPASASDPASQSTTATIHFAGDWKGAVLLRCSAQQAVGFSARLMPSLEVIQDEDVRDAVGELANMIGGNLKAILPPGVALSMPSVTFGRDFAVHIWREGLSKTIAFDSDLGAFWVTLVEVSGDEPISVK